MKITKKISIITVIIAILLVMAGCDKKTSSTALTEEEKKVCGSWAYNHDTKTPVAIFREDGTATYEDKDYTFDCEDEFIILTDDKENTMQLRYRITEEGMDLYRNTTYTLKGNSEQDGILGEWVCEEQNWSFYFTSNGNFMEDGYFTGQFTVDEDKKIIHLTYGEYFNETDCYYRLDGDKLMIEYPWGMVHSEKK